jgi:potassium-transporting ATPase potassium-binding subunit
VLTDLLAVGVTYAAVGMAAWPLGLYMAKVYRGQPTFLSPVMRPVERGLYRLLGVSETDDQPWTGYLVSVLAITAVGTGLSYLLLRLQDHLPLNPQGFSSPGADLALNTAVSFVTNTSWQSYAGEQTMSYLSQMLAIGTLMFLSAGTGMAVAVALVRAFAGQQARGIGNFFVDLVRSILYVLLPLSIVGALFLASFGVVQTLQHYTTVRTLQGATQVIAQGPVASFEVIKDMSGDGGGFFNANSAHPFENPNGLTNQFEVLLMLIVPFAFPIAMGRLIGGMRQGVVIFMAMWSLLLAGTVAAAYAEQAGNPALTQVGVTQARTGQAAGGNMEGKEVRFGPVLSAQFAAASTGSGDGAVDSSHDSFTPLGGMVPLLLMKLGELSPGGPGAGLYGMLLVAILAVFVAGLMIGRTPEYLGKKIELDDMRLVVLGVLIVPMVILAFSAISLNLAGPAASISNPGPHGMAEVLYAFTSTTVNNGSAFAGLTSSTVYYNVLLAVAMWLGRFGVVLPVVALAGVVAAKRRVPAGAGTLATATPLFGVLLVGFVVILGALTFFPALALAPVLEQLRLVAGHLYH